MINLILIITLSYLVGAIPTALLVSKKFKGIDIRQHGSKNAGGTNVLRVLGWKYGLSVIFLDAVKGALAVILVARLYFGPLPFENVTPFDDFTLVQIIAGIFAVVGHIWTIFANFKGGKGIATSLGFLISIITVDMLLALAIFVVVVYFSKYISLGSLSAAFSIPVILFVRENVFNVEIHGYHTIFPFTLLLALLVAYTHRTNIGRLLKGNENRFSFSKKDKK